MIAAQSARAADITDRMTLVEAIEAVRAQGYAITYSSQTVKPWMRVRSTPAPEAPLDALREVLGNYDLDLQQGPGERWLIVPGEPRPSSPQPVVVEENQPEAVVPDLTNPLEEIVIVSSQYSLYRDATASGQFLNSDEIQLMPHLADDTFRAFHRLPGVAANDFQAPIHLRGGDFDEVKVLLDGIELYQPFHMRTLFSPLSIIDPGIIGGTNFLSGGYTADQGNALSGVADIRTDRISTKPRHQLGVSFVNAFARSGGAFAGGCGDYLVSARRGYLDLIADSVTDDGEEINPRYSDVFGRVSWTFNSEVELAGGFLVAPDDVEFINESEGKVLGEDSSANYAWLSLDLMPGEAVRLSNRVFYSDIEINEAGVQIDLPFEDITRRYFRDIRSWGIRSDLSWQTNNGSIWKAGLIYRDLEADYDYKIDSWRRSGLVNGGEPYVLKREIQQSSRGEDYGVYSAFRFQATQTLALELGARWDRQTYLDTDDDSQFSPRFNAFFRAAERTEVRLGWGLYFQPRAIGDLDVPDGATEFGPAQRSEQRIISLRHEYLSGVEIQADLFDKHYSDLRPRYETVFDSFQFAPESNFDRVRIEPDSARAYGLELTLRSRVSESLDWWLNYTWSRAEDKIDGESVPRSWDQRHALTANLMWRGEKWSFSLVGRYHSGWPRTPLWVFPEFDENGDLQGIRSELGPRNSESFGDYSRLDVRLSRRVELENSSLEFYLEIFNVFNSDNQCCVPEHQVDLAPEFNVSPNYDNWLPFFPSFGLVWTFGPGARY